MAIDISNEELLTIAQAARRLPGRVAFSTIWRWALQGVRGVRLETAVLGGKRYTSVQAMQRFSERCLAAANGEPVPTRTAPQRKKAIAAAQRQLDAAGIWKQKREPTVPVERKRPARIGESTRDSIKPASKNQLVETSGKCN